MAIQKAGTFVDELLRRTRDPQAGGTPRSEVRLLLGHAQRVINAATAAVLTEKEYPLEPKRTLYDLDEVVQIFQEPFVRLVSIRYADLTLLREDWQDIARQNRTWLRTFGPQPFAWAPIGGNLFMVYPGPEAERVFVTLVLVRLLPLFDDDDGDVLLPLELHTRLLDLAEGLIFLRRRQPADAMKALERASIIALGRRERARQIDAEG